MKIRNLFNFEADGETGGSLAVLKSLGEEMVGVSRATKTITEDILALKADVKKVSGDAAITVDKTNAELALIRESLKETHGGKSGVDDAMHQVSKFITAVCQHRKTGKCSDASMSEIVEKAAVNFATINTGAGTAGYLMPELLMPGMLELTDVYGNLYPLLNKMTLQPGQKTRIVAESVRPVAKWRTVQSTASLTEEDTPAAFGDNSITTEILYVLQYASNELIANPSVGFGAIMTGMALRALTKKVEVDFLGGVTGADACPSASMVATATDQGTIASATFANIGSFLEDALDDDETAAESGEKVIFMHPRNILSLALQPVGVNELTGMLVWGDPRKGIPATILGYQLVSHPGCKNQATSAKNVFLFNPKNCFLGESASFSIDFSEHVAFVSNRTAMRFSNHFDWAIPIAAECHRQIITA
jgi:HK97 family phage major capsid protein